MRSPSHPGATLAVSLMLLTALGGCGGDDQDPGQQSASTGPNQGTSSPGDQTKVRDCKVAVTLTGAVSQTLKGPGRAIYDNATGPQAFYQFTSGDTSVQVYSDGQDFTASVVISTRSGSFTSEPGTEGLDVSTTGKSAKVDSDTVGLDENSDGVHVKAIYTCA
jgi:hypothetical protein